MKRIQRRLDAISPAQLVGLGKIFNSLKDGMSAPGDWFDADAAAPEAGGEAKPSAVSKLRGAAKGAAERGKQEPAPEAGGEDPEEKGRTIAAINRCTDQEVAAIALDGARGKPWYAEAEEAYRKQFPPSA